ncbi:MAG: HAMP domain-containing histidine kinase [Cytophagales bacterium]|nr:HAMP domain-containing histidine kinase [Cytophagales bacterium]
MLVELVQLAQMMEKPLQKEYLALAPLVDEVMGQVRRIRPDVEVEYLNEVGPHCLVCDRELLQTILYSLVDNAVAYRKTVPQVKPQVRVSALAKGSYLEISVEDNGIGIDPKAQGKVFDLFYRATERSVGHGLGLYLASEAAHRLGTQLQLKPLPQGSLFWLRLPLH